MARCGDNGMLMWSSSFATSEFALCVLKARGGFGAPATQAKSDPSFRTMMKEESDGVWYSWGALPISHL